MLFHANVTATHTSVCGVFADRDTEYMQSVVSRQPTGRVGKYALSIGCLVLKPSCSNQAVHVLHTESRLQEFAWVLSSRILLHIGRVASWSC